MSPRVLWTFFCVTCLACTLSLVEAKGKFNLDELDDLPMRQPKKAKKKEELVIEDIKVGNCESGQVKEDDIMMLVYHAVLLEDGEETDIIDSSMDRGRPMEFHISRRRIIQAWDDGILGMCVGGQRKLTIPPSLGYKGFGLGQSVPPYAWMVHYIELHSIMMDERDKVALTEEEALDETFEDAGYKITTEDLKNSQHEIATLFAGSKVRIEDDLEELFIFDKEPQYLMPEVRELFWGDLNQQEQLMSTLKDKTDAMFNKRNDEMRKQIEAKKRAKMGEEAPKVELSDEMKAKIARNKKARKKKTSEFGQ
mmetsp:Transcript_33793/g.40837  ORF Transcript_33793/g.40837 Transcript_33793/m.40837 type:complete len:309 (+) Transcript_33793:163-1089(+)|eukprot:CAMPEP_0197847248 /NCGR_PEP_ID=MMETSP1438-20131217/5667_1 /TAXON_ID=1461541 /ORGANISM="Pterosperma sp., Strain CCMP1384" /LENGTH=308 /DNA_ID=CAMNT_0043459119 /DNA_START=156 /DNA_END=1082 /DNA_ORIENTATION=-